jgi:hypothetical protein
MSSSVEHTDEINKRVVEVSEPVSVEIQPDQYAVIISKDAFVTYYVPGEQENALVLPGILVGMASVITVFAGFIKGLMMHVSDLTPQDEDEEENDDG